jgi:hypothetical protein
MTPHLDSKVKTVEEGADLLARRNRQVPKRAIKALLRNGGTDEQVRGLEALSGSSKATPAPLSSQEHLIAHSHQRSFQGVLDIIGASPSSAVDFERYHFPSDVPGEQRAFDLRLLRRSVEPQLKVKFDHYLAVFRPLTIDQELQMSLGIVGVRSTHLGRVRRSRSSTPEIPCSERCASLEDDATRVLAACSELWELSVHPDKGVVLDGNSIGRKLHKEDSQLELEGLTMRAFMPIDKVIFGHGLGKLLSQAIGREVRALAKGLDLVGSSPVQPQAIPAFLAGFPGPVQGTNLQLPAIKLLG